MVTESGLAEIVGDGNVSGDPAILEAYAGDLSFVGKVRPRFVVKSRRIWRPSRSW